MQRWGPRLLGKSPAPPLAELSVPCCLGMSVRKRATELQVKESPGPPPPTAHQPVQGVLCWQGRSHTEYSGVEGSSEITEAFFTLHFHPFDGHFPGMGSALSLLP